jgi:hypothetical protein
LLILAQTQNLFMKKYLLLIILFVSSLASVNFCYAQGVAINTDGSTADPSAVLDVKSTAKGVLVPRMALSDRNLITSPATGLLIYQTDNTPGFYYNAGIPATPNWIFLGATGPAGANGPAGPPGAGFSNGTSAGQVFLTGSSPFSPQGPQSVTGDITINSSAVTSYNNIVPANKGGAGAINGILSANGAGTVSAASTTGSGSVVLASGTTGSGSAVLATSPTLVTPILGTPQSGNATNLTNLNATQLTSGTIPAGALPALTGDIKSTVNTATTSISTDATNGPPAGDHMITDINQNTTTALKIAPSRLGSGTPGTTNYLRGDGSWQPVSGGGGGTAFGGTLTNGNTIAVTTPTFYLVTDGASITLPAATTAGQTLYLVNTVLSSSNNGFTINKSSTDATIFNVSLITPASSSTGAASANSFLFYDGATLISDGNHHWYVLLNN